MGVQEAVDPSLGRLSDLLDQAEMVHMAVGEKDGLDILKPEPCRTQAGFQIIERARDPGPCVDEEGGAWPQGEDVLPRPGWPHPRQRGWGCSPVLLFQGSGYSRYLQSRRIAIPFQGSVKPVAPFFTTYRGFVQVSLRIIDSSNRDAANKSASTLY